MPPSHRFIFVSSLWEYPWGGSEELWSRTALSLVADGVPVSASVLDWSPQHERIQELKAGGVDLWGRPKWHSRRYRPWLWMSSTRVDATTHAVGRLLATRSPALVVFSDGGPLPPINLLELCTQKGLPFVTLGQANYEHVWYPDDVAERYRCALGQALRCLFVSHANLRLAEKQIGGELANAEVVWNPVNISVDVSPPWPPLGEGREIRFATVGRLDPGPKGQDILFEALAKPAWQQRRWKLHLYGEGPMRQILERLSSKLRLGDRVVFAGTSSPKEIWASNHVLVMPSRWEGLPLAMVEAMLCNRPVIATDVAGHAEIVEDGATGFLASAATPNALADALERFWTRRDEAEEIGKAGGRRIRLLRPSDPVRHLADKLKRLAQQPASGSAVLDATKSLVST